MHSTAPPLIHDVLVKFAKNTKISKKQTKTPENGTTATETTLGTGTYCAVPESCFSNKTGTPFHLAFPVRDIEESRKFYGGILGCVQVKSRSPNYMLLETMKKNLPRGSHIGSRALPKAVTSRQPGKKKNQNSTTKSHLSWDDDIPILIFCGGS
jgi:hypothetical protein